NREYFSCSLLLGLAAIFTNRGQRHCWPAVVSPDYRVAATPRPAVEVSATDVVEAPIPVPALGLLAQSANGGKLRGQHGELALDGGDLLLVLGGAARFLGALERLARLRFVEIGPANRRVCEHGDDLGLHFEDATGDEDQLLFAAAGGH